MRDHYCSFWNISRDVNDSSMLNGWIAGDCQAESGVVPSGRRGRGRPKKTWMEGIREMMTRRYVRDDDWEDRVKWRRMCEEQLSGVGSGRCPP